MKSKCVQLCVFVCACMGVCDSTCEREREREREKKKEIETKRETERERGREFVVERILTINRLNGQRFFLHLVRAKRFCRNSVRSFCPEPHVRYFFLFS